MVLLSSGRRARAGTRPLTALLAALLLGCGGSDPGVTVDEPVPDAGPDPVVETGAPGSEDAAVAEPDAPAPAAEPDAAVDLPEPDAEPDGPSTWRRIPSCRRRPWSSPR